MATIYIDPDVSGVGTGSFGDPFKSWASTGNLVAGNSYLQKEGTTFNGSIGPTGTGGTPVARINIGVYNASTGVQITNRVGAAKVNAAGQSFGMNITNARPYIDVNGFEIFGATSANITKTAANNADPQYCTFKNLILHSSPQDGLLVNGLGNKVINCTIYNNGQDGARFVGNDLEVAYCNMYGNGTTDVDGDCIQLLNCNNPYIHHNTFRHSNSRFKQAFIHNRDDGVASGGRIEYNTSYCAEYDSSLFFDVKTFYIGVPNVTCLGNKIYGGQYGAYLIADNIVFKNNVVVTSGILEVVGVAVRGSSITVKNNTVVALAPQTLSIGIDHSSTIYTATSIVNNAVLRFPVGIRTAATGATYSYNAFNQCTVNNGDINRSLQAAGTGDVTTAMALYSSYELTVASSLKAAGLHTEYALDVQGVQRNNPPAIGAFEYISPRGARV